MIFSFSGKVFFGKSEFATISIFCKDKICLIIWWMYCYMLEWTNEANFVYHHRVFLSFFWRNHICTRYSRSNQVWETKNGFLGIILRCHSLVIPEFLQYPPVCYYLVDFTQDSSSCLWNITSQWSCLHANNSPSSGFKTGQRKRNKKRF